MVRKTKYYYIDSRDFELLREPIEEEYYNLLLHRSLERKFPHLLSVECDDYGIFKDYYSLNNEFTVYVECIRRYV